MFSDVAVSPGCHWISVLGLHFVFHFARSLPSLYLNLHHQFHLIHLQVTGASKSLKLKPPKYFIFSFCKVRSLGAGNDGSYKRGGYFSPQGGMAFKKNI